MTTLQTPKTILFDWDTTLVDNWAGMVIAWNHTLRDMDRPPTMTREAAIRLSSMPPTEIFLSVFGAEDAQRGASLFYTRMTTTRGIDSLGIIEGSVEMLDEFAAAGITMGVVSNKKGFALRQEVDHLGWNRYFFASVGAGDAAYDKPHPAPVLHALQQRMIQPGPDVWMIGDMHSDIQAAKRAGVTAILIETTACLGLGIEGDLTEWPPDARVRNAIALRELVKETHNTM